LHTGLPLTKTLSLWPFGQLPIAAGLPLMNTFEDVSGGKPFGLTLSPARCAGLPLTSTSGLPAEPPGAGESPP
jgi:hypothetical protein